MKNLSDIMTTEVSCAYPETSIQDVSKLMVENHCGEIPIVESKSKKRIVGVLTDRDIVCRTLGVGKNPMTSFARDCMTSHVISVNKNTTIHDCIQLMRDNKIRRLPVVNENKELCGMVSLADLVGEGEMRETIDLLKKISSPSDSPSAVH